MIPEWQHPRMIKSPFSVSMTTDWSSGISSFTIPFARFYDLLPIAEFIVRPAGHLPRQPQFRFDLPEFSRSI